MKVWDVIYKNVNLEEIIHSIFCKHSDSLGPDPVSLGFF